MEFTKEQTLRIYINNRQRKAIQFKYRYTTKTKWWCLHCLKIIYTSYKQYGRRAVLCDECYTKSANHPTIAQYQYIAKLKNIQINMLDNLQYFDENIDKNFINNQTINKNIKH